MLQAHTSGWVWAPGPTPSAPKHWKSNDGHWLNPRKAWEREREREQQYKRACVSALTGSVPRKMVEGLQRVSALCWNQTQVAQLIATQWHWFCSLGWGCAILKCFKPMLQLTYSLADSRLQNWPFCKPSISVEYGLPLNIFRNSTLAPSCISLDPFRFYTTVLFSNTVASWDNSLFSVFSPLQKRQIAKKIFSSKIKAHLFTTWLSNIALHLLQIWLQTVVSIDSESCQRLFSSFCKQPSGVAVLFNSNLSRRPFLGNVFDVSIQNMLFCSYIIFFLRDKWIVQRLS